MSEIIHDHILSPYLSTYPRWSVTRQPAGVTDPMVVRFHKVGKNGNLLDQNARWTALGWDTSRWVPGSPQVPKWLIDKVVERMRSLEIPAP